MAAVLLLPGPVAGELANAAGQSLRQVQETLMRAAQLDQLCAEPLQILRNARRTLSQGLTALRKHLNASHTPGMQYSTFLLTEFG